MRLTRRALTLCAILALQATTAPATQAQAAYPGRPITLVVPFASGGSADRWVRKASS